MNKVIIGAVILVAWSVGGCADQQNISPMPSVSADARKGLKRPVSCKTAKKDIATLEAERASVAHQVTSGVRSVLPMAAVAGILTGDYSDRVEVATGQYNADIDAKIAQIKRKCKIRG